MKTKAFGIVERAYHRIRGLKSYRVLARKLIHKRIQYRIATHEDALGLSSYYGYDKLSSTGEVMDSPEERFKGEEGWLYYLVASMDGKIAGAVVVKRFPETDIHYTDWWLFSLSVKTRFRGTGIGKELVKMASERAANEGGKKLNLLVHEDNRIAVVLYQKMGFRRSSMLGLDSELEKEFQQTGRRRIIMSAVLSEDQNTDR